MRLTSITVERFRNFVAPQTVAIEDDVTCLVGKNESGKTTLLLALHRLKPANETTGENDFDLTIDYPRWRLARDRRNDPDLAKRVWPIRAVYALDDADRAALNPVLPAPLPPGAVCHAERAYEGLPTVGLRVDECADLVTFVADETSVADEDRDSLLAASTLAEAQAAARARAGELKETEPLRSKALSIFATTAEKYKFLLDKPGLDDDQRTALWSRVPRTFYFSQYHLLPGECDLTDLAAKVEGKAALKRSEQTIVSLLRHAGEKPADFLDEDYASRKAELQAASTDLTRHVFNYWRQNEDLEVIFDTDNVDIGPAPNGQLQMHRMLKIEIRDGRHGGVETNFATRSTGFQWFFSFFAAFSAYQNAHDPLIVLLDEPGTSLHGEAQQDFVRYVFGELGESKQTMYTTHSQHMIDPARYEKLRAVHDRATRADPDLAVEVTRVDLSADRATILPVESALGYTISQHLFLGSGHHLAVEGSSDFVYLLRVSEHAAQTGGVQLDPRFAVIPVGGDSNMPAFVAIMGRRLKVSALIDGAATSRKADRVRAAAAANQLPPEAVVSCGDLLDELPKNADIEDLFDVVDYLRLYNWAFSEHLSESQLPQTSEPILRRLEGVVPTFDHALPAHALTEHRDEFFASVSPKTVRRFEALFQALNAALASF
ncbi:MAG TPA: AAA family ATPase [Candidatus Dormibacteraeota bacterium]|nr:AAA family ATPase [Candidatus Dormibacteraeota bacterium]